MSQLSLKRHGAFNSTSVNGADFYHKQTHVQTEKLSVYIIVRLLHAVIETVNAFLVN